MPARNSCEQEAHQGDRRDPGLSLKEKLALIRIWEELRARGFDGGYDAVRRNARDWGSVLNAD